MDTKITKKVGELPATFSRCFLRVAPARSAASFRVYAARACVEDERLAFLATL